MIKNHYDPYWSLFCYPEHVYQYLVLEMSYTRIFSEFVVICGWRVRLNNWKHVWLLVTIYHFPICSKHCHCPSFQPLNVQNPNICYCWMNLLNENYRNHLIIQIEVAPSFVDIRELFFRFFSFQEQSSRADKKKQSP